VLAPIEFKLYDRGDTKIWLSRRFEDALFLAELSRPNRLFELPGCEVIKDQKKTKVARLTLNIAGIQRSIYIKRFNAFSLRFRLLSPFYRSGALRSLRGAEILRHGRIGTVEAIAAVERRSFGMLDDSFIISEEIPAGKTADTYWRETLQQNHQSGAFRKRRAFLRRLGSLFGVLHACRIYHNDLKDANILVGDYHEDGSVECFLLDLEGVRQCVRLSKRRRIKNLVQLYRTLGRYLSRSQRLFFLKCYLGPAFSDSKLKRRLAQNVLRSAKAVDRSKNRIGKK
jgi:hypothetical protein